MGKVFKILTAGLLAGLVHSPANAALVSFTSDGTFSNVTNCNGGSPGCAITNSGNLLKMSGASDRKSAEHADHHGHHRDQHFDQPERLRYRQDHLGEPATYNTDQNFNVNYTFSLNFTSPNDVVRIPSCST